MKASSMLIASAVLALTSCSNSPQGMPAQPSAQQAIQPLSALPTGNPKDRIDPDVFAPYKKADYPKLVATLGKNWARGQQLREAAAFKALENPLCRNVDMSEINVMQSTSTNLLVFVYCNNGKDRFDFSEADVKASGIPRTNADRAIDRKTAIQACSDAAKSLALHPSLVDTHTWAGASFSVYRPTGAARVLLDFDATNAFGQKMPYRADCLFPAGGQPEITVVAR